MLFVLRFPIEILNTEFYRVLNMPPAPGLVSVYEFISLPVSIKLVHQVCRDSLKMRFHE